MFVLKRHKLPHSLLPTPLLPAPSRQQLSGEFLALSVSKMALWCQVNSRTKAVPKIVKDPDGHTEASKVL